MIRPGPLEIGLVLVIILIIFGAGKLPQVGSAIGKGIRSFKKGQSGEDEEEAAVTNTKKKTKKKAKKRVAKEAAEEKGEAKA